MVDVTMGLLSRMTIMPESLGDSAFVQRTITSDSPIRPTSVHVFLKILHQYDCWHPDGVKPPNLCHRFLAIPACVLRVSKPWEVVHNDMSIQASTKPSLADWEPLPRFVRHLRCGGFLSWR